MLHDLDLSLVGKGYTPRPRPLYLWKAASRNLVIRGSFSQTRVFDGSSGSGDVDSRKVPSEFCHRGGVHRWDMWGFHAVLMVGKLRKRQVAVVEKVV